MLSSPRASAIVSIATLLSHLPTFSSASALPAEILPRAPETKFFALGDSFASGIAAGSYVNGAHGSHEWLCSQFDHAYSYQLNGLLAGGDSRKFTQVSCSGYTTTDVTDFQQPQVDADVDMMTLTVGGNNVGFGAIVNACVYRFTASASGDCDQALADADNKISTTLWNEVWNTVFGLLKKATKPTFRLYVTGYVKYWNADTDQCSNAAWTYWKASAQGNEMTKERRKKMNDLADKMNSVLASVVQNFHNNNEHRAFFVNYDAAFEGHRFCEQGVTEPSQPGEDRSNTWVFQYNTPVGSLTDTVGLQGPVAEWIQEIKEAFAKDPSLKVNDAYAAQAIRPGDDFSGGAPLFIAKIFHPTSPGHTAIAKAIKQIADIVTPTSPNDPFKQFGPSQFCMGLSPGGGNTCINIPDGCYINVPIDNTIPTPICLKKRALAIRAAPQQQQGPSQFCMGLSPGGGNTCINIPDGCYINIPIDNTIPTPICDNTIPSPNNDGEPEPEPETVNPDNVDVDDDTQLLPLEGGLVPRASPGQKQWGRSQFCMSLSPGGGETCITIKKGCFIIIPIDNTIPTQHCPRHRS